MRPTGELRFAVDERDVSRLVDDLALLGWRAAGGDGARVLRCVGAVRLREKLEALRRVMGHDLAAPARGLKLVGELIGRSAEVDPALTAAIPGQADAIMRGVRRLEEYLQCLLAVPVPVRCAARELVRAALSALDDIDERTIEVRVAGDVSVTVDRTLVAGAVRELVDNAVRYTEGSIDVEVEEGGEHVEIAVVDRGPGIDGAYHDIVFELGRRLHTSEEVPGSGVGLTLCAHVADLHGGRIDLESAAGRGCRFLLRLPRVPARTGVHDE